MNRLYQVYFSYPDDRKTKFSFHLAKESSTSYCDIVISNRYAGSSINESHIVTLLRTYNVA